MTCSHTVQYRCRNKDPMCVVLYMDEKFNTYYGRRSASKETKQLQYHLNEETKSTILGPQKGLAPPAMDSCLPDSNQRPLDDFRFLTTTVQCSTN